MKKCKKLLSVLLAALLLVGAVPAYAANGSGGLNGSSGAWSAFDHSVYDTEVTSGDVRGSAFTWPSSGTVLVRASATASSYTIAKFNGITIPAGLIVDIYKYDSYGDTYTLLGHFDTTDGKPYTIGSSSTNVSNGNTAIASNPPSTSDNSGSSDNWTPYYEGEAKWGKVRRTFKSGTPSASYKNSYDDVASNMWYYDAIMTMTDGGLLNGYGNGKFGPNDPLTRAQLAIINARTSGSMLVTGFEKTRYDNDYQPFADSTAATRAWAAIVLAGKMPKHGNVTLTSYELSLVEANGKSLLNDYGKYGNNPAVGSMTWDVYDVWRASLAKDITYRSSIDEFPDADAIHKWIDENADVISNYLIIRGSHETKVQMCETYFLRAYNLGMFRGVDAEGTFDPYGSLTRGQLCQALYNVGWTYAECLDYDEFHK